MKQRFICKKCNLIYMACVCKDREVRYKKKVLSMYNQKDGVM